MVAGIRKGRGKGKMGCARESFEFYRANFSLFLAVANTCHVFLDGTRSTWELNLFLLPGNTPSTETRIIEYRFDREVSQQGDCHV